ncbi:MAG: ATP-dependent RecD-like DNA helicase [Clostridia bacterium]|nr:ATP-dependent RecD-like DNA helicase [Clostridia bacterium]MDD4387220.1 ATP-dependent RecD-like DNA helicase [Clostridia bacterium]
MKITGKVVARIFHNASNGYTVLVIKTDTDSLTAVGETSEIEVGDMIELEGSYDTHNSYGDQFKFSTCTKVMPKDRTALVQYISDNIKGVGKKTATNIVNMFEDETVSVIRMHPDRLSEVSGLNEEKIENLRNFFLNEWEKWNTVEYLSKFGISVLVANKIYETLRSDTIAIVKEDPYSLLGFVKTLDFKTIDKIGLNQGISHDNSSRICAGILYSLSEVTEFGHTCIEEEKLIEHSADVLGTTESVIENGLISLKMNEKIYIQTIDDVNYVFISTFYLAERNISETIIAHANQFSSNKEYKREIEIVSEKHDLILSEEQMIAISTCLNNSISVITGGPGTGKTTIIKCIIDILSDMKKSYVLAAPTGRAAKRITETTGKEAKTLHRLLEITKLDDRDLDLFLNFIVKNIEADVVIVDEASMIDTLMMNNLLKAMKTTTKIILVGDVNQLPSVGPGSILKDIIDSEMVPTVFLREIYRQSSKSDIIMNAHKVNRGEFPEFKTKDTDLFFLKTNSIEETVSELSSLIAYRLSNFADINIMTDLQVLTPTKKNELGTYSLNKTIQNILNPKTTKKHSKEHRGKIFREDDKVMQIINNYDREYNQNDVRGTGIYNGDIGYISHIDNLLEYMVIIFDDDKKVDYKFDELDELEHAYAVTIHKSQGSEYDYVIIPLYSGYPKLFTRNLLYTAMTRAKKILILIGNRNIINFMVENIEENNRKTGLKHQITKK